jgi:membrane fusion protein
MSSFVERALQEWFGTEAWRNFNGVQGAAFASQCKHRQLFNAYCEGSFFEQTMNTPLFRSQVTQAKQASWLGGIHLAHNPRFSIIAGVALVLAGAFMAFGAWGKVARKVRVPGVLMPHNGTVELSAVLPGILQAQLAQEGQWVAQGQVLFVLNTDKTSAEGSASSLLASHLAQRQQLLSAEQAYRTAQHHQREIQLVARIRSLALEVSQAEQEHALVLRRVELAHKTMQRFAFMALEGFVSDIQTQNKQEDLLDQQSRLENTKRSGMALAREHITAQADLTNLQKQWGLDQLLFQRSLATLQQEVTENNSRNNSSVLSPQAGYISTIHLPLGAMVQAGQTIASFVPQIKSSADQAPLNPILIATLFAPTRTAGFVQPGQDVWLRLAAYPYQKFGLAKGRVLNISGTPIAAQDLPHGQSAALLASTQSNEPLYRVQVSLASQQVVAFGESHLLRPGMTLEADIIHDVRGIWEWVFEPLLALHARQKTS